MSVKESTIDIQYNVDDNKRFEEDQLKSISDFSRSNWTCYSTSKENTVSLHDACADPLIAFKELLDVLECNPKATLKGDFSGPFLIHIVFQNIDLMANVHLENREMFLKELIQSCPGVVMIKDKNGHISFTEAILNWIGAHGNRGREGSNVSLFEINRLRATTDRTRNISMEIDVPSVQNFA
eukprot:CAMPEP_0172504854 /NCGR_PEP_ID=MMETSP1066-20121228/181809_1 /TAXON_ID=671091 /ORGANISM="Coscinodiscus wailesii, Strain CCMP2513" /LENGTH=181 /DNA_ID=CAMNT_0013281227 /DNA_START=390 /DNA_END=931 /DNA_ORIENTATION=-